MKVSKESIARSERLRKIEREKFFPMKFPSLILSEVTKKKLHTASVHSIAFNQSIAHREGRRIEAAVERRKFYSKKRKKKVSCFFSGRSQSDELDSTPLPECVTSVRNGNRHCVGPQEHGKLPKKVFFLLLFCSSSCGSFSHRIHMTTMSMREWFIGKIYTHILSSARCWNVVSTRVKQVKSWKKRKS